MERGEILRRIAHMCSIVFLVYYIIPDEVFGDLIPGFYKWHAVLEIMIIVMLFELFRLRGGTLFPGLRSYEEKQMSAFAWFALAMGIAIGGAALGAVVAPPLTVYLISIFGWRGAFVATGIFGGIWVLVWLIFFHKPHKSRFITNKELSQIEADAAKQEKELEETKRITVPLKQILRTKQAWGLISIRFLLDPVFYFFMFWIPKYLNQERGVSFERIGALFWIPFFALGISNIIGGGVSDRLINGGLSVNRARKSVMGLAALLTMVAPLTVVASSAEVAILFMSLIMFAHGFWITNYITIISELFGRNATSTVVGMSGTAGAVAGLLVNPLIGKVVENYSYLPMWIVSGVMYPMGFIILVMTIRQISPLKFRH